MRSIILIVCLALSIVVSAQSSIQEFMNSKDLSSFKVDMLSDEDITKYKAYVQSSGLTETQIEQMALQRGLPSSEILKLKARLAGSGIVANKNATVTAKQVTNLYNFVLKIRQRQSGHSTRVSKAMLKQENQKILPN